MGGVRATFFMSPKKVGSKKGEQKRLRGNALRCRVGVIMYNDDVKKCLATCASRMPKLVRAFVCPCVPIAESGKFTIQQIQSFRHSVIPVMPKPSKLE